MNTKLLITKIIVLLVFISGTAILAQSDINSDTKINMPNNWGISNTEKSNLPQYVNENKIPPYLREQYRQAKLTRNEEEKIRVGAEIEKYLEPSTRAPEGSYEKTAVVTEPQAPFSPDWYNNDILVHSGDIWSVGYRQLDLKRGEDGWLYLAINRRNVSGFHGYISVYRSSNGGINWTFIFGAANSSAYFGSLTMLVEKRHATNNDSTRIMLFYTRSASTNMDNAAMEVCTARRDGSAAFADMFASPASGNKYEYPTASSDGIYWDVATYMHVVARECTNAGSQVGLRHWLSQSWCSNFSNILINTGYNDNYPSAAYCEKVGDDSIYIAVERRISGTEYEIRAIITCEWLTPNHHAYYITSAPSGVRYERPCITVQQQHESVPRRILITYTRNNLARYCYSVNGGQTWTVDAALGTNGLADFTWCSSDSLTSGDGYAVACFVDQNGDSITVRRGNMTGSLGTYHYKRNSNQTTGLLVPVCAIYKVGTAKHAAFAYTGFGPANVYFNNEALVTGVIPEKGEIPEKFVLMQNFPNPFNPVTNIRFNIPKSGIVSLRVFDVLGNEVAVLVNENLNPNSYEVSWDANGFSSGVYFYKLVSRDYAAVRKMILVK